MKQTDKAAVAEDFNIRVERGKPDSEKPALFEGQKVALCLPGGGAKGAFQAGVLRRLAMHHPTYNWIAGISVGALNGAMMATGQQDKMVQLWDSVTLEDVARKRSIPKLGWEYLKYKLGITHPPQAMYSNKPLLDLLMQSLAGKEFDIPFLCGSVDAASGEYTTWKYAGNAQYTVKDGGGGTKHTHLKSHISDELPDYSRRESHSTEHLLPILASTAVPVLWDPVRIGDSWHIDGGVRNINPIKDLIAYDPDVILVIPTERGNSKPGSIGQQFDILESARRTMAILLNEIFQNDISACRKINDLVMQAKQEGIVLESPTGRPLKYYQLHVIEPQENLGDIMDFSRDTLGWRMRHGEYMARGFLRKVGLV